MKKLLCLLLVVLSMCSLCAYAETDYSFMDGMSIAELDALIAEAQARRTKLANAASAGNPADLGMWTFKTEYDMFGLPTDNSYIVNKTKMTDISWVAYGSTYTKMAVEIRTDKNDIRIHIFKYGDSALNGGYGGDTFHVYILDSNNVRHTLYGTLPYKAIDGIRFNSQYEQELIDILSAGGTIRFVVVEDYSGTTYNFTIQDATGFANAYAQLMGN